ncbi:MAG: D-aminoacylase [Anaerolineales bacterium]|nr:D-aminoacylase [Anaerolineales bacterium]
MLDILIQNGLVVDGSGTPRYRADVAIEGDHIVEVGQLKGAEAEEVIDASGCVVTPGFVDMHSHADFTLPIGPTADSLVHQGITTAVIGQCGASPAPLLAETRGQVLAMMESEDRPLPWDKWSTFSSYLDYLRQIGLSVNAVPLVGQGMARSAVMAFSAKPANEEEIVRMQAEVIKAMDEGAIGVSTGLIYPPGSYASTEELIAVTRPAGEQGGFYFSHVRNEGDTLLEAVAEAIRIGRETGAAVQISHFKAAGRENWHKSALALELIDQARAEGLDVTADMYPYLAGGTGLVATLPEWAQEGGKEAIAKRLTDPQTRQKMTADMKSTGFFRIAEWDKVLISGSPKRRDYEGRSIADLAAETDKSPHDWIFDALLETEGHISMILFMMSEDNREEELRHPAMMIGTDASGLATEGPLSKGTPHPRSYGTFPRVLGHYVREQGVISLEEAIWKMSGFPAHKLRWPDRGLVKKSYKADLVILNPDTVTDRATYEAPHQYPVGIPHVIVNGKLVIHNSTHTRARPGNVL